MLMNILPGSGTPVDGKGQSFANLNFLRGFANPMQKKVTRDGQPAKRRGPKPDSKPAQTRRQELNRQAQRSVMITSVGMSFANDF